MKVKVEYHDSTALAAEEIIASMKARFGDAALVTVLPDSLDTYNMLYFAVQNLITDKQLEAYFHDHQLYEVKCKDLVTEVLDLVTEVTEKVIRDNERKLE